MLRKWTSKDLNAICELERECFSNPWSLDMLVSEFEQGGFLGYLIENEGEIIGYAGFSTVLDEANLDLIAVAPKHRKKGYAKALATEGIKELFSSGINKIYLEVRKKNLPAISLYEALGFTRLAERKNYYGDDDAIIMAKCYKD